MNTPEVMTEHVDRAPARAERRVHRRWWMVAAAAAVAAVVVASLAAGWDAGAWLRGVWDSFRSVSLPYLAAALALQTTKLGLSAAAWHGILRYAYPEAEFGYLGTAACYSTGVALNNVLPANAGTIVTVMMLVATIGPATPAGVVAAAGVEKLFFAAVGVVVAVYLFVAVGGTFGRKFGFASAHPWATVLVVLGVAIVVLIAGRLVWRWLRGLWEQARRGGRILGQPRAYLGRVALPQLLSWGCALAVVAVLLAAYRIPVTVHTLMSVQGGTTVANVASLTPGGIGVNQVFSVASLHEATSAANASAYSVGQQLLTTAWNILLAIVLVAAAFGPRGRQLFEESVAEARERRGPAAGADG